MLIDSLWVLLPWCGAMCRDRRASSGGPAAMGTPSGLQSIIHHTVRSQRVQHWAWKCFLTEGDSSKRKEEMKLATKPQVWDTAKAATQFKDFFSLISVILWWRQPGRETNWSKVTVFFCLFFFYLFPEVNVLYRGSLISLGNWYLFGINIKYFFICHFTQSAFKNTSMRQTKKGKNGFLTGFFGI